MKGKWLSGDSLGACDPVIYMSAIGRTRYVDGSIADPNAPAFPCGLVAKSIFNDTFNLTQVGVSPNVKIEINETNIAWESDVKYKFRNI